MRIDAQTRSLDIAPTLLDIAGIPIPQHFEGASLLPLLTGAAPLQDGVSYAALGQPLFPDASLQFAVRDGLWTYGLNRHWSQMGEEGVETRAEAPVDEFLFDRSVDPGENVNLLSREPEEAAGWRSRLRAHLAVEDAGIVDGSVRIDPAIADRLRAMGYLRQ